jgi:hypothetical protein
MLPPIVLNQSSLKAWLNCNRLYGWERIQRLQPASRRSTLEIGIAVHAGLAAFHAEKGGIEVAVRVARESLDAKGPTTAFEGKTVAESKMISEKLLRAYVTHWAGAQEVWAPLNQEIEFLVEVGEGTGVFLRGRADNLSIVKGALFIVDYKTAARMDVRDMLKYELDFQLTSYIYGLSKQLTKDSVAEGGSEIRVEGAIIDLLVKTEVPQFAREMFTRSDAEMAEFEEEFVEYGHRLSAIRQRLKEGEPWKRLFPKNTEHCFRYGTCPYRDLCLSDSEVRRAAYIQRPLDYVDEAQAQMDAGEAAP